MGRMSHTLQGLNMNERKSSMVRKGKYLRIVQSLYIIPHDCDVCDQTFDVGYAVVSDDGTSGDICGACLKREDRRE